MKSFYKFLETMDTGLRGELESGFGSAAYNPDQEKAVSTVVNLVMQAAASDMSRLMTMLRTLSSRDPSMRALYDQIDVSNLRSAARKNTGISDPMAPDTTGGGEVGSDDNMIKKPSMDSEFSAP